MTNILKISSTELLGQSNQHIHFITEHIGINKMMLSAYSDLVAAAKKEGIDIAIASGFRSFERQLHIWNNKFSGKTPIKDKQNNKVDGQSLSEVDRMHAILLFSALPGASRHHWGCDIDVYASNLLSEDYQLKLEPWEYDKDGPLEKLSHWLKNNAHLFGFYLPYKSYQGGVAAEPWHLSYAPLARQYQDNLHHDLLVNCFNCNDNTYKIFGQETILENLDKIIKRYINNVNDIPDNCYNHRKI